MKKEIALALASVLIASMFTFSNSSRQANAATEYITIDSDPNNSAYQIDCTAPDNVYMSTFVGGKIAEVDKDTKAATLIQATDGVKQGSEFYSIVFEPSTNAVFVNEQGSGLIWKYDVSTEAWQAFPIVEKMPGNPKVIYRNGYENYPLKISIDENPSDHHLHAYNPKTPSFQQLIIHDGTLYSALSYHVDFDTFAETNAGVTDMNFAGIAKVNPASLEVTRIPIAGAFAPSAIHIDNTDSNMIWVADRGTDILYKFDLAKRITIAEISLPQFSNVHNMADDGTYLYIPLSLPELEGQNSLILKLNKADSKDQVFIDSGAPNTDEGTFGVFLNEAQDTLYWTDLSHHVGSINLKNNAKLWQDNRESVSKNHFGCSVDSEFWWAAHASADIGIQSEEATQFTHKVTGTVKQESGSSTRNMEITITGAYSCDANMRIKPVAGSLSGTIKDGSDSKITKTKVTFEQVDDYAIKYFINTGTFGKVSGKTTFGSIIDCHNDIDESKQTKKNSMTFTKNSIKYKLVSTSDLARTEFD